MEKFKYLLGREMDIIELSNELTKLGCEDICEFGDWDELLDSGIIIVATDECGENHIGIEFEVTRENSEDEIIEAAEIKIFVIQEA